MAADPILFRDLAYIFVAALFGGLAAWRLRLPLILGFVVGGIVVSPLTPGPSLSNPHNFELFAEVGVVLLMFSIGIEFSLHDLFRVKWVALLGGPLGILVSIGLGVAVATLAGWGRLQGVVLGAVVSVASTMVLARLLMDRKELGSVHGRLMIGITLTEDLAVVVLTVLLPNLGANEVHRFGAAAWALTKALLSLIERLGINLEKVLARMPEAEWALPEGMKRYFKYGNDRESIIRYLMKHRPEPSSKELAKFPAFSFEVPKVLRSAMLETAKQFPRLGNYRTKIAPTERAEVCRKVQRLMRSKPFPQAVEVVARQYGVHARTIRRIWKAWKGERQ